MQWTEFQCKYECQSKDQYQTDGAALTSFREKSSSDLWYTLSISSDHLSMQMSVSSTTNKTSMMLYINRLETGNRTHYNLHKIYELTRNVYLSSKRLASNQTHKFIRHIYFVFQLQILESSNSNVQIRMVPLFQLGKSWVKVLKLIACIYVF